MKINKFLVSIDMTFHDCKTLIISDFKRFGGAICAFPICGKNLSK